MSDAVIKVENLSKRYTIGSGDSAGYKTIRETIVDAFNAPFNRIGKLLKGSQRSSINGQDNSDNIFWALKDISFEVNRGEVVGIIGRNGAGKSTLLKILSKITEPTTGRIELKGRVGSLLEVGTGFHPELTGHENVYLYGAILGMDRWEITRKFDEIVAFAELDKFIDTPVKRYSSGMYMRLAFAVAAHLEPEILLVDEVLAVGDAAFQKKCLGKMGDVSKEGRTVLFVSHNMNAIQKLCTSGILISNGRIMEKGVTEKVINKYLDISRKKLSVSLADEIDRVGNGKFLFTNIKFNSLNGDYIPHPKSGEDIVLLLEYKSKIEKSDEIIIRVTFKDKNDSNIFICNNFHSSEPFKGLNKNGNIGCIIYGLPLPPGTYYIDLQCLVNRELADEIENAMHFEIEMGDFYNSGKIPAIDFKVFVRHDWKI